jgi:serine protease DegS
MPDFTGGDKPGVGVTSVLDGGPAKAAGMQDGDRIVKIGGEPVKDIYGYMDALREFKPGATIEIVVVRKDEELTLKLTLQDAPKPRGAQ